MLRTFFGQKLVLVALAIATTLAFSNVVVPAIGGPSATKAKKAKRGPRGPQGAPGPQGPPGAPGAPATSLWALVAANGTVTRASNGPSSVAIVHNNGTGTYTVFFNQGVNACSYGATLQSTAGTATDQAFNVAVFC